MTMEAWVLVVVMAVLVEAIVQVFKGWTPEGANVPAWLWPVVSAGLGVAMCIAAGVDGLTALGVKITVPVIGQAVTGVLVSRGSNFVHDLWHNVRGDENGGDGVTEIVARTTYEDGTLIDSTTKYK